jgi:hypothetical protein
MPISTCGELKIRPERPCIYLVCPWFTILPDVGLALLKHLFRILAEEDRRDSSLRFCYIYIYIYVHTYIYTHIYICVYVCVCVCVYIPVPSKRPQPQQVIRCMLPRLVSEKRREGNCCILKSVTDILPSRVKTYRKCLTVAHCLRQ